MEYKIEILTDPAEKSKICENILRALPEWFGIENANKKYIQAASELPALAVKQDAEPVALLVYKLIHDSILDQMVTDIYWLGVLPEFQRKGLGKNLLNALTGLARHDNGTCLTVETLDPVVRDENYLKTFKFYEGMGFSVFHRFRYDENNPMVKMKMQVPAS